MCPLHLEQGPGALGLLCFIHDTTAGAARFPLLKCIAPGMSWSPTWAVYSGFPGGLDGKESTCNAGDPGSIPGLGRSPGEGNGYPLQYSCLKTSMDREAWWAIVCGVTKSQTQLTLLLIPALLTYYLCDLGQCVQSCKPHFPYLKNTDANSICHIGFCEK